MKGIFSLALVLLFISGAAPHAQARPPIKKILQSIGRSCETKLYPWSKQIKNSLLRKAKRAMPLSSAPKAPFLFTSLETVSAYYGRLHRLPPFPLPQQDNELYRGMTLDASGKELRYILKKGLDVSKSHSFNFAAYNGRQYPDYQKAIYTTPEIDLAVSFAFNDTRFDKHIPVILHLKRVSNTRIVSIPHDVPAHWIHRVSALLTINGRSQWGEIRLTKEDHFIFIPYPPPTGK